MALSDSEWAEIARTYKWLIGQMFEVPWSPNPHRLEDVRPQHCSLHGDFIGYQLYLRKRRNSATRPWGCCYVTSADNPDVRHIKPTPESGESV